jgi:hypothetical protein
MNAQGSAPPACVVMPPYNKREFVLRAVTSVLVDNGSIDGGGEVLREISNPRFRIPRK